MSARRVRPRSSEFADTAIGLVLRSGMAVFDVATNTPTKVELMAEWLPTQPWGPPAGTTLTLVGSYHLDDPHGEVGLQGLILDGDGVIFHVPLTYRATPLPEAAIATMEHSVLGTRHVHDGLRDAAFVSVFAGLALTGLGEAIGFADVDGRWCSVPSDVRVEGGGGPLLPVEVDGFGSPGADEIAEIANDRLIMRVHRRPTAGPAPSIGVRGRWSTQPDPVVLAAVELMP